MAGGDPIARAAAAIAGADALLIGAGAGMGVDSGLPDFRGAEGFWQAYPPFRKLGLNFMDLADPVWFRDDPELAWGFYGHRRNLYRKTTPHGGFAILKAWAERLPGGGFVFTSNVDGQFQRAGFDPDRIVECHGAIDWSQCTKGCGIGAYEAEAEEVAVDESTMRATPPLPSCPSCGALARPNILMFGDGEWEGTRTRQQNRWLDRWITDRTGSRLVVVECGAGRAVPSVRIACERAAEALGGTLIRINVREPRVPGTRHIGIDRGALDALTAIDARLDALADGD